MSNVFAAADTFLKNLIALGRATADGRIRAGTLIDPVNTTVSGTVQSTVYPLNSVALPAGALAQVRTGLLIVAGFLTAANANAKDITVKLGATAIATLTGSTANAKTGHIKIWLYRVAKDSQFAIVEVIVDGALVAAASVPATATIDDDDAIVITLDSANTAAAAASATGKGLIVTVLG